MAAGPFVRIIAQVAFVAGGAIFRAFLQAYKEATVRGMQNTKLRDQLRGRMNVEEARKILGFDSCAPFGNANNISGSSGKNSRNSNFYAIEDIIKRKNKLLELNAASEKFAGSPYIQRKVENASAVLEEHIRTTHNIKDDNDNTNRNNATSDKNS